MEFTGKFDFIVIGSGGGGFCAALAAHALGMRTVVLEKAAVVGGTTALSGGVLWIPDNPVIKRRDVPDTYDQAQQYLAACAEGGGPAASHQRRHAFLIAGPRMVSFLENLGMEFVHAEGWSCYHELEKPGGMARGRSICGQIFNLNKLGPWKNKILRPRVTFPILGHKVMSAALGGTNWNSRWQMFRVGLRMIANWLGAQYAGMGLALQGRMLKLLLDRNIPILTGCTVERFIQDDSGRITGVSILRDGAVETLSAAAGVLIAAGGFSRDEGLRRAYQPDPTSTVRTYTNAEDTGGMIKMGMELGAATALMDQAVWVPTSILPNGMPASHPPEMARPHCILVDQTGQRYVNESTSYVTIGQAMYRRHQEAGAVPSWCIMDGTFLKKYRWAGQPAGRQPIDAWVAAGYMKKAASVEGLAKACSLDAAVLQNTISRFNGFAKAGKDEDFRRGHNHHNRFMGDPLVQPNPVLGAIDTPPFYAVQIFPGDVGTCGGLLADEHARVLRPDGTPIQGLYVTGNSSATPMGKSYPGAGASIGPAFVFGYIAAQHAAQAAAPAR